VFFCARIVVGIISPPSAEIAMRKSSEAIAEPELRRAVSARSDYCKIRGFPGFGWNVECNGILLHRYATANT